MSPLIVNNLTNQDLMIQGQNIPANGSYTLPSDSLLSWAKDAYLRILVLNLQCSIAVFGTTLGNKDGADWLELVSNGNIVYS